MRDSTVPLALVNEGLGNTSYLVDLGDGRALVVDPERDPGKYLAAAEARGLTIGYTAETHLHADFVSGSRELAAHGAQVLAPAAGGIEFGHRGLRDGDELGLGGLALRALATPGHTPEHLVGFQNSATSLDLGFYPARSYSLMRPPRTGRRLIRFRERSATGWSGRGARSWRLRWGRRPL